MVFFTKTAAISAFLLHLSTNGVVNAETASCGGTRCFKIDVLSGEVQDSVATTDYGFAAEQAQIYCNSCGEKPSASLNPAQIFGLASSTEDDITKVVLGMNMMCGGSDQYTHTSGGPPVEYVAVPGEVFKSKADFDACVAANGGGETGFEACRPIPEPPFESIENVEYLCAALASKGFITFESDPCCSNTGGGGGGGDGDDDVPCFSAVATVQTQDRGQVAMNDLQVGDHVLTTSGFSKVYTIDHRNENKPTEFLQLHTDWTNDPLEVTSGHLIYLNGKQDPVQAGTILTGDEVLAFANGQLQPARVTDVTTITRKGLYNPITSTGTLIVDGLATSTYTAVPITEGQNYLMIGGYKVMSMHDFLHLAIGPLRTLCSVNDQFCQIDNGQEYNRYSQMGFQVIDIAKSQNVFLFNVIVVAFVAIFALFSILSNPIVLLGSVIGTLAGRKMKNVK